MFVENSGQPRVLIVDDEPAVRDILGELLSENYRCVEAASAEEGLALLQTETFDLIISDIQMSGISGLEMIPLVADLAPDTIVIMISGAQSIESAIRAMRAGAFDYITKPFDFEQVQAIVARALEHQSLRLAKKHYENHLEELVAARTDELHEQIVERQRAEETVNRMAYYDALTGLPNPTLFRNRLTHHLDSSKDSSRKSATIILHLDRFKNIKDTLGHETSDEVLRCAARRLTDSIRQFDTAAYFGGAEFALHLTRVRGAEDTLKIAQRIKNVLLAPFKCGEHEYFLSASLGISLSPDDGADAQTLLQHAGTALYRARQNGGDGCQFYTIDMHKLAVKRLSLENDLRHALDHDEFLVHFQPQINARSGGFSGMEALVRWQHPTLGLVPPNDFVPIAEDTNFIIPLGEWVLRRACQQNAAWRRDGLNAPRVSVNLSLKQFQQPNLVEAINRILVETELAPEFLELELTESAVMNDVEQSIEILRRLKMLGIRISLDDFGSGYSSLSHLKILPLDALKIDRDFVRHITADSKDAAIVKTIVALAENLGLKTIVEGVETAEQSAALCALGCTDLQGFFFGKPVSADAFELLLQERQPNFSPRGVRFVERELYAGG